MKNVIATIIKFSAQGAGAVASAIGSVHKAAGVATRGISTLASSLGSMGGSLGKAASQVANFMWSVQQMGAVGGIIAGVQMAITMISDHFIEAADKMAKAADELYARVHEKLMKINREKLDGVAKELDEATVKAEKAARAFDILAANYMKVERAKVDTEASQANVAMAGLTLEKSRAMAGASDENEAARIGAAYDEKIARARLDATRNAQEASVAGAEDELTQAKERAADARKNVTKASRALKKAEETYDLMVNSGQGEDAAGKEAKALKDKAKEAFDNAVLAQKSRKADAEVAEEKLKQAKDAQASALLEARREVVEAEKASRMLADAQIKAAKAELDREKAAQKAAEAARRKAAADERSAALDEKRDSASAEVSRWQGAFDRAFDLWRDPEAAQQAVDADRKRGEDMKAFRKAVSRYGGKGKIDEYAALMRAGDEEGMQERLSEWRKSSKFTPQVEQLVKAAAADQNRNAAEKSLAQIEKNTGDLAKKIDELLSLK